MAKIKDSHRCSFCGKDKNDVIILIEGMMDISVNPVLRKHTILLNKRY
jgi:hypothetical protein